MPLRSGPDNREQSAAYGQTEKQKANNQKLENHPMQTGLLILINLLSIPFIHEIEIHAKTYKKIPTPQTILKIKETRKSSWFKGYLALVFIFAVLAISPTRSKKTHHASTAMISAVITIQAAIWATVIIRAMKKSQQKTQGTKDDTSGK